MPTPDQLSFDGRPVASIAQQWGDWSTESVPEGMNREELADLKIGDRVYVGHWYQVEGKGHDEKCDDFGMGTKPMTRKLKLKTLAEGFEVKGILSYEERMDAQQRKIEGQTA